RTTRSVDLEAKSWFGRALQHLVAGFPQHSSPRASMSPESGTLRRRDRQKASGPHHDATRRDEAQKHSSTPIRPASAPEVGERTRAGQSRLSGSASLLRGG